MKGRLILLMSIAANTMIASLLARPAIVLAGTTDTLTLANFEETSLGAAGSVRVKDPRLNYSQGTATHSGVLVGSLAGDGDNSWTVTSDTDPDEYADFDLVFSLPQDWSLFTTMQIKYWLEPLGGANSTGVNVWMRDATSGTYIPVGTAVVGSYPGAVGGNGPSTVDLAFTGTPSQRRTIDAIKFRVRESWFGGAGVPGRGQRTHLYDVKIKGSPTMEPNRDFWPLPTFGSTDKYWWAYKWTVGAEWMDPNSYAYDAGSGPDECKQSKYNDTDVALVAHDAHDGALRGEPLIAIEHYKDTACSWWQPGVNRLIRWYSRRAILSHTPIFDTTQSGNAVGGFLSFHGTSSWNPNWNATIMLSDNIGNFVAFAGTLPALTDDHDRPNHYKTNFVNGDDTQFPNYSVIPTKLLDADVVLSQHATFRKPTVTNPQSPGSPPLTMTAYPQVCFVGTWSNFKNNVCDSQAPGGWAMSLRRTTFLFEGKKVQYVGFSEAAAPDPARPADPPPRGACEDWWFAEGVGPIYIVKYPHDTLSGCQARLAAHVTIQDAPGHSVPAYHRPELYIPANKAHMMGYLTLSQRCLANCEVSP